jgi:hypothetical protein
MGEAASAQSKCGVTYCFCATVCCCRNSRRRRGGAWRPGERCCAAEIDREKSLLRTDKYRCLAAPQHRRGRVAARHRRAPMSSSDAVLVAAMQHAEVVHKVHHLLALLDHQWTISGPSSGPSSASLATACAPSAIGGADQQRGRRGPPPALVCYKVPRRFRREAAAGRRAADQATPALPGGLWYRSHWHCRRRSVG